MADKSVVDAQFLLSLSRHQFPRCRQRRCKQRLYVMRTERMP